MSDFYIQLILHTVIGVLASSVKNPNSTSAQHLRVVVQQVSDSCQEFLAATDKTGRVS